MQTDGEQERDPAPSADSPDRLESIRRRVLSIPALVSLLVAGGFLVFLVTRFDVDIGVTWDRVRGANPWLLVAAFAVHYTTFFFRGARWRMLLEHAADASGEGAPVPGILFCSRAVLLGWFVNSIGWLRLGDAFRAYLYREEYGAPFSGAIGTVLAERVLDVFLVALMLLVVAPFLVGGGDDDQAWVVLTAIAGILVLLLILGLAAMVLARERLLRWFPDWLASRYQRFHTGTIGGFRRLPQTTLLGLLGWAAEMGRMYLVAMALGVRFEHRHGGAADDGQLTALAGADAWRNWRRGVGCGRTGRANRGPCQGSGNRAGACGPFHHLHQRHNRWRRSYFAADVRFSADVAAATIKAQLSETVTDGDVALQMLYTASFYEPGHWVGARVSGYRGHTRRGRKTEWEVQPASLPVTCSAH